MENERPKRPSDPMQLAKQIGDEATGQLEAPHKPPMSEALRSYMSALGKIGGKKGGKARAKALTKEQLSAIGRKGARALWKKKR